MRRPAGPRADGEGDEIAWINVGDSRVYLFRDDELIQLSRDHSLVEDLSATASSPRTRPRSTRSATSSPGPSASTSTSTSTGPPSSRSTATASCSAATACSARSPATRSPRSCAAWPTPTRRPTSWCAWPTRPAAATTSPWSSSRSSTTTAAPPRPPLRSPRRPRARGPGPSATGPVDGDEPATEAADPADPYVPVFADRRSSLPDATDDYGSRVRRPLRRPRPVPARSGSPGASPCSSSPCSPSSAWCSAPSSGPASNTYFVGFDGDNVADLPGQARRGALDRPGARGDHAVIERSDLPEDARAVVAGNKEFGSEAAATRLRRHPAGRSSTSRRTTSATTTTDGTTTTPRRHDHRPPRPRPPPRPPPARERRRPGPPSRGPSALAQARRRAELGLLVLAIAHHRRGLHAGVAGPDVVGARPTSARSSPSSPACSSPPTSPSAASRPRPTACCSRWSPCSTASATCSSPGSTRSWPTTRPPGPSSASPPSSLTLAVRPPVPRPRALPLHVPRRRPAPAGAAAGPRPRRHHQRRPDLGGARPDQLPARRVRQDRLRPLLRLVPGGEARAAVDGHVAEFRPVLPDLKHLGPVLLAWGIAILVMTAQKDLGSSLLFFALFIAMLWVATGKVAYPVGGAGLFARGGLRRVDAVLPRAGPRVDAWLEPVDRPAAGLPGRRRPGTPWRGAASPAPASASAGPSEIPVRRERLHLRRHRRGARPARRHRDPDGLPADRRLRPAHRRCRPSTPFDKLLAAGLTALLGFQAFVILAGVTRLLPLTGVVLPFVSYGGSALVANYVLLALLLRISDGNSPGPARGPPADGAGGVMDRSIRRLGVLPDALLLRAVRAAQLHPGVPGRRPQHQAGQRPARSSRRSAGPAARSPRPTACSSPARCPSDDRFQYQREYPEGELYAALTGFFNYSRGATGLERAYNDELSGKTARQQIRSVGDLFVETDRTGNLKLTVRSDIQEVAKQAARRPEGLGRRARPAHRRDPRALEQPVASTRTCWPTTTSTTARRPTSCSTPPTGKPLLPKAYREIYPPGSTFKVVTGSTGVETRRRSRPPSRCTPPSGRSTLPRHHPPLPNFGGSLCGGTLFTILAKSCNTSFAQMGLDLGGDKMVAGAEAFGFNAAPPFDLPAVASAVPDGLHPQPAGARPVVHRPERHRGHPAADGAGRRRHRQRRRDHGAPRGQRDPRRRGRPGPEPRPHPVEAGRSAPRPPTRCARACSRSSPTAAPPGSQIPGLDVGAKTGTAQFGPSAPLRSHAWVIAWAGPPGQAADRSPSPSSSRTRTAPASPTGGRVAAPIAKQVIEQSMQPMPAPPAEHHHHRRRTSPAEATDGTPRSPSAANPSRRLA